jgi:prophage tail gpP-like protein
VIQHELTLTLADGFELTRWESWELETDYRELPSTTWRVTFGPAFSAEVQDIRDRLAANPILTVRLDGILLATGRMMGCQTTYDADASFLNITGADSIAQVLRDCLPLDFRYQGDGTVVDLLTAALAAKGIEVVTSNASNLRRLTGKRMQSSLVVDRGGVQRRVVHDPDAPLELVDQQDGVSYTPETLSSEETFVPSPKLREMQPHPTEKVEAWIQRVCETENLVAWVQADGKLFVGRPSYETHLAGRIVSSDLLESPAADGVIKTADHDWKPGDQKTRVTACGRINHSGDSTVEYTAIDEDLEARGYRCEERIVDSDLHDQAEAMAVALRQLRDEQLKSWQIHAVIAGFGVGRQLIAPGLMIRMVDNHLGVKARLFCIARKLKLSPTEGGAETTDVTLVRPNLWGMAA